jgi:hypothetical protein
MEAARKITVPKTQSKVELIDYDDFVENICPDLGCLGMAVLFFSNNDVLN